MKTRTKSWIVILTSLGVISAVAAVTAQDSAPNPKEARLAKFLEANPGADANGDGVLTIEEFRAYRQSQSGKGMGPRQGKGGPGGGMGMARPASPEEILKNNPEADTDGDGKLSPEELRAFGLKMRAEHMLAMHPELDTDGDGVLSEAEMKAAPRLGPRGMGPGGPMGPQGPRPNPLDIVLNHFDKIDTDGNGQLSKAEIEAFKKTMPQPPCDLGMGAGPGPKAECDGTGPGPAAKGKGKGQRGFRGGTISPEMRAKILEKRPEADTDGDGVLSDEELAALKAQRGAKKGGKGKGASADQ